MFYDDRNRFIFESIKQIFLIGGLVDLLTIKDRLTILNKLDFIGGDDYLNEIIDISVNKENFGEYVDILEKKYLRRKLIDEMTLGVETLLDEKIETNEVINLIKSKMSLVKIGGKYFVEENPEMAEEWLKQYKSEKPPRIMTGLEDLDVSFGGFSGSELALIIASTNVGKSTMLINMAINMAKAGKKILFFSLEMGSVEMNNKFISILGNHSALSIYTEVEDKEKLKSTVEEFKKLPIALITRGAITSQDVINEAYNRKLRGDVDVVMVDYLQRLCDRSQENEVLRLGNIARNLKNFALINNILVITPVQVDKASSKNNQILVENVAWSKDIANEADIAFYLYERQLGIDETKKKLRLRIVKSRNSSKYNDFEVNFDTTSLKMDLVQKLIQKEENIINLEDDKELSEIFNDKKDIDVKKINFDYGDK